MIGLRGLCLGPSISELSRDSPPSACIGCYRGLHNITFSRIKSHPARFLNPSKQFSLSLPTGRDLITPELAEQEPHGVRLKTSFDSYSRLHRVRRTLCSCPHDCTKVWAFSFSSFGDRVIAEHGARLLLSSPPIWVPSGLCS
jgi:hypothetical protein